MKRITKVYTRTGDKGTTSLVGGVKTKKDSARIEAYGTVDELSANLGLLAAMLNDGHEKDFVQHVQNCLFNVCTHLATDQSQTPLYPSGKLPDGETERIESEIDAIIVELPERLGFVLPGGTREAAMAHVCRTVCRRAERRIVTLAEAETVSPDIMRYVNRLSDYLFVLAKKLNFAAGMSEKTWSNPCE
jgi:cob(I)alamin adenosyltransferase